MEEDWYFTGKLLCKQNRQWTYNITLKHIHKTTIAEEKQEVLNILSGCLYTCLSYPPCKLHLFYAKLYCHLWPVWLNHIFPHYLMNRTIFRKDLLYIKCVFWFSLQLLSETFLILRRIQRDIIISVQRFSCSKILS